MGCGLWIIDRTEVGMPWARGGWVLLLLIVTATTLYGVVFVFAILNFEVYVLCSGLQCCIIASTEYLVVIP